MYGFPRRTAPLTVKRPFLGFDALSIPGCRLWLAPNKLKDVTYSFNGFVSTLKDGSPDNRSVSSNFLTLYNNKSDKIGVVPRASSQIPWNILGNSDSRTIFYIGFFTARYWWTSLSLGYTGFQVGINDTGSIFIDTGSGYVLVAGAPAAFSLSVFCFTAGISGLFLYINGTQIYQNTSWSSTTSAGNIFHLIADNNISIYFHEVIVYDSQLTSSDVAYVSSVLGREYGIL